MSDRVTPHSFHTEDLGSEKGTTDSDQAVWRRLIEAETDEQFCSVWLSLQSCMLSGVHGGMVVLGPSEEGPFTPVAFYPQDLHDNSNLAKVTERALKEGKGVVIRDEAEGDAVFSDPAYYDLAYPLRVGGKIYGVAAIEMAPCSSDRLQSTMRQLQWGAAWIENWLLRRELSREARSKKRITGALELAAATLEQSRFQAAATSFATLLATRLECDRVSIGFLKGKHVKVHALSHSANFKQQMNLIRSIGAAMDESVDQQAILIYPDRSNDYNHVLRAHESLAEEQGDGAICTVPFVDQDGNGYGALTLERSAEKPFDTPLLELCDSVAALVAPILDEKRKNDQLLVIKAWESTRLFSEKLLGPRHVALKLITSSVIALIAVFSIVTGEFRVSAKTTIEGAVQRAIVAPFDGFIYHAPARAGDIVQKGEILCSLDERELRLQRLKWASQKEQYDRQYREAMAKGNRAGMKINREQANQADAQLNLLDDHLAHAKLTAPFEGVVVSGDLSQSLGAPVERGKVLFEVAPLSNYRVRLHVDEHDISYVKTGQKGELVLNSLPDSNFPITVQKVTPVSTAKEGNSFFLVEASLDQQAARLRPGMEGVGKVSIDRRKLIWIWVHDLINWVRLWVWSWWP